MSFFCPDITTDSGAEIANNCDQDTAITLLKRIFSDEFIDAYITGNENPALVTGVNTVIGSALSILGAVAITAACIITILGIYKWITESANDGEAVGLSERGGLMGIFGRPLFALSMLAPTASGLPIINIIIMTVALWSNSIANQMYFKFIERYTAVPKPSAELYNNSAFKNANDMLKPTLYGALIGYCTKVANTKVPGANLKMYYKAPDTSIANVQKYPYLYKDLGMGFGGARNLCGGYTDINYLEDYYVGDGRSTLMFGALSSNLNITDDRIEAIVDDLQAIRKKNSKVNYLVVQKRREYAKSAFYQGFMTAFGVTGNSVFTYAHNFMSGNIRTSGNYGTGWNVDVGNPSATDLPNEATLIRTAEDHTRGLNDQVDRILGANVSPELAQKSKELQARLALSGWLNAGTTQSILRKYSSQSATGIFQRPYEVFYSTGIKSEETKDNAYLNDFVTISDIAKEKIVGSVNESGAVNSEMAVQDNIEKLVDNPKSLTGLYESTGNATLAPLSTLNQTAVNALIGTGQDDQDDALYRIQSTGETIIMAAVATKTVLMVVDSNIKLTKMATRIGSVVIGTIPFLDAAQKGEAIANTIGDGESFLDKWILAPALALAEDFMKIGKTLSVTIPVMPYFFLLLAATGWVVQIIQTSFGMPLWLIMHAVPDRSFIGSQQQGYVTLIALLFRPALILAGFYVSFVLYDPILTFYTTGFWQVQATLAGGSATNSVSEMLIYLGTLYYYWLVFCAGLMMITYLIFGLTQELSDGVLSWLGTNLLQNFGNLNTTSTMQGAASKINSAGSGIAAKRAALAEKRKAQGKKGNDGDGKDDKDGKDNKDPDSKNVNSEKTSDGDVPLKSDLSSDEKSMTNNLNAAAAVDLAKQSLDEENNKGAAEGANAEDDPMKTLSNELNAFNASGIIKDDKEVSDTSGDSGISANKSGEADDLFADDSSLDAEQSSNQAKGIMGLDSMSEDAQTAINNASSSIPETGTPSSTQDIELDNGSTVQATYDADGNLASVTASEGSATATQFADGSMTVTDNNADTSRQYEQDSQGSATDSITDNNTGETTVTSSALAADGTRVPVGQTVTDSNGNVVSSNNFAAGALGAAALGGAAIASSRLSDSANAARSASASALSQVSSTGTPSSTQDVTLTDGSTVKASYGADGSLASVTAKEGSATATQFADGSSRVTDNTADSAREYTENAQGLGTDRITDNNTGETTVTSSALAADGTRVPVGQTVTDSNGNVVSSNNFAAGDAISNGLTNSSTALAGSAALAGASVNPAVAASALAAMTGAKLASAKPSQEAKSVASKGLSGFNPEAPQDGSVVRKADGTSTSMPKQNSDGSTSTAKYNANGQLDSVTTAKTANGNTAIATQFANGEMKLAETKSNGDKTDYHEKADGSSISSAFNAATGQTVTSSVAAHTGATTQTVKDANGNVVASSESKATNALAGVAGAGMVARELAANSLTNIPSTAAANSTDITQANGVTRIANYDDQGKLASVTQKADDGNGRPVSVTRNSDGTVRLDQSNGSEQRSVTRNADGSTSVASSNSATGVSTTGYTNPTGDSSRQDIKNAQGVTLSSIATNRLSNGQTETVETTPSSKIFRNNDATGGGYTEKSYAVDPQGNVSATPTSVTQATVANGITTATTTDLATNNQIVSETKPNGDATVRSFTNTPSGLQETAAVSTAVGTDGSKTTSSFALNEAGVMARTSTVTQSPMVDGKADITVANANGQVVASGSVAQSGGATTTTLTDKATGQVSTRSDFADGTGTEVVKSNGQVISRAAYATTSTNRSVSSTADRSGVTISAAKDGSYTAQHVSSGITPSYAQGGYVVSNNASPNTVTALAQVVGSATSSHSASAAAHAMSSLVQQQAIAHAGSLPAGAVTTIAGNAHTGTIAATLAHTDGTKTQASYSQGKFTFANQGSAPQQASVTLDPQGGGMMINMAQEGSNTPNQIRFNQNGSFVQSSEVNGESVTTEGFIGSQDYTRTTTSPATPVSPAVKEVVNHSENQGRQSSVIQTYVGDKLTPDSKAHVVVDTNQSIKTANLSMSNGTLVHSTTDLQANTTDTQVSLHGTKFEPATATESAGTPKVKGNGFMALKSLKEIIASLKP